MTIALALVLALFPQSSKPDPAAELAALQKEFGAAQQAFFAGLHKKQMAGEEVGAADFEKNPAKDFLPKFEALVERAKGTETELNALRMVVQLATNVKGGESKIAPAIEAAFARHLESPAMETFAQLIPDVGDRLETKKAETLLRALIEKSPHKQVRAAAKLGLVQVLDRVENASASQKAETKALLQAVAKESEGTRYAERANARLFEMEHLQVGCVAPEIASKDQDGKVFKLSDQRGKVVVLDFWGFW